MSEKDDPKKFLGLSHHQLNADANELDADTREKLLQIQHRVRESSSERKSNFPEWASLPLLGFITALIFISKNLNRINHEYIKYNYNLIKNPFFYLNKDSFKINDMVKIYYEKQKEKSKKKTTLKKKSLIRHFVLIQR